VRLQLEPLPGDVAYLLLHGARQEEPSAHIRQRLRERLVPLVSPRVRSRTLAVLPWTGLRDLAAGVLRSRTAIAFASFSIGATAASALRLAPARAPIEASQSSVAKAGTSGTRVSPPERFQSTPSPPLAPRVSRAVPRVVAPREPTVTPVAPSPRVPRATTKPTLQLEGELLEKGRIAMVRGDTDGAFAAVEEHLARFRDGKLSEEREALRIQTLVAADRDPEARTALGAFRRAYPKSLVEPALDAAVSQ